MEWYDEYVAEGDVSVDAYIVDESLWITQKSMAKLFGIDKSGISRHLNKIFKSGELKKEVVVAKLATTNPHGAIEGFKLSRFGKNAADVLNSLQII